MACFLANENFPRIAVEALRSAGYDTAWIVEIAPGSDDDDVLARAYRDRRILLTFDKDFGDLAVRRGTQACRGVILFRLFLLPQNLAETVVSTIASRDDWENHLSIVEPARVRMKRSRPPPDPEQS